MIKSKYIRVGAILVAFVLFLQFLSYLSKDERQGGFVPVVSTLPPFLLVNGRVPADELANSNDRKLKPRPVLSLAPRSVNSKTIISQPLGWIPSVEVADIRIVNSGNVALPKIVSQSTVQLRLSNFSPNTHVKYEQPPHMHTAKLEPVESAEVSQKLYNSDKILQVYITGHRRALNHFVGAVLEKHFPNIRVEYINSSCDDIHLGCKKFLDMRRSGKIIHVMRDVRDTMVSFYLFVKRNQKDPENFMTFSEFLQQNKPEIVVRDFDGNARKLQRTEFLRYHIQSWLTQYEDVYHVQAEKMYFDTKGTLRYLSTFLQRPYYESPPADRAANLNSTETHATEPPMFNGGRWKNFFSKEDEAFMIDAMTMQNPVPIPFLQCIENELPTPSLGDTYSHGDKKSKK